MADKIFDSVSAEKRVYPKHRIPVDTAHGHGLWAAMDL